jgi:DNA-directed RNA polymerase
MPTVEDQKQLEYEMVQEGVRRYTHENQKMLGKGLESKTSHGRALVASVVTAVAEGVKHLQTTTTSNRDIARKKLKEMEPDQVAYLSLISVIDGISKRYSLMKVARAIGMHIEDQDRLTKWLAIEGKIAQTIIAQANEKTASGRTQKRAGLTNKMNKDGFKDTEWTNEERIHVGLRMVDVIITSTGIIALRRQTTARNKTTTFVEATPETLDWIRNFNDANMNKRPRYSPCIIPPKDWDGVWGGGYYSEVINRLPLVRAH